MRFSDFCNFLPGRARLGNTLPLLLEKARGTLVGKELDTRSPRVTMQRADASKMQRQTESETTRKMRSRQCFRVDENRTAEDVKSLACRGLMQELSKKRAHARAFEERST